MSVYSNSLSDLVTFSNSQGTPARGTLLRVSRTAVVFEVYNPYSIVQLSEVLQNLVIRRADEPVYRGKAVVSSLVNTGLMLIVSATLVDGWQDLSLLIKNQNDVPGAVGIFIGDWEKTKRIRPGYQVAVGELRSFLSQLNLWLAQVELNEDSPDDRPFDLNADVFDKLKEPLKPKLHELLQRFEYEAKNVSVDELESHCSFAQRDLLPLMMRAPFFHRSYTKPLGYAGDYEMVNMMIHGLREGPTTYAQLVNDFYLETDMVRAHRNRLFILQERLSECVRRAQDTGRVCRILNVGCGPAIELERFIRNDPLADRCHIRLVDFNDETLNYARGRLEDAMSAAGRRPTLEYVQQSVHGLLKQSISGNGSDEPTFDFVYCAGLFDYLSDRICQRMLTLFCRWTTPGGTVLATNVHPDNPSRWLLEHVVEWHLIHRTKADMLAIAPADYPARIFDDDTQLNVFLEIQI
jgi:extracellular factor (EF) 3-hydroxypalmitic acid methyl ester biosynthesis protein